MKYIIIIVAVLSLAVNSCNIEPKKRFVLSPKQALAVANNQTHFISPQMLADILYVKDSSLNYFFVDLRNPLEYEAGHLEGAVNIPFLSMTKNNNCNTFLNKEAINIIYGSSLEEVVFAGFILQQIGINNFFLVHGNYEFIEANIVKHYEVMSANFNLENSKYDFGEIMNSGNSGGVKSKSPVLKVAGPAKKGKEGAGGGCN